MQAIPFRKIVKHSGIHKIRLPIKFTKALFFSEKFSKKINYNFDKKNRLDLINFVIKKNKYKKYLEIGCNQDEVFKKIVIDKIGVDPVNGGNFRGTSDDFFIKNSIP